MIAYLRWEPCLIFLGKWLSFLYLRRWLLFASWDPGLLPWGEALLCVPSWLVSVWQEMFAFVLRKAVYQVGPLTERECHLICHSEYLPDSKPSTAIVLGFLIGRGHGSVKFLLVLLSSLVPSVTVALGCSWLQVYTGEMRAFQPPPRPLKGKP